MTGRPTVTRPPERPVDPAWLALREPADAAARDRAAGVVLAPLLADGGRSGKAPLRVVDLGAGTGANLRWLAPRLARLSRRQEWTLVDSDPHPVTAEPFKINTVRADVAELARLLHELGRVDLVTASALLDLLDRPRLAALVAAVVQARAPALLSLTVTGEVTLDPPDGGDAAVAAAFDDHQRRGGRPGPDAAATVAALFRDRGWTATLAASPWQLRADQDAQLLAAWLGGRVEAAVQQRPSLAAEAQGWLARRRTQLRDRALTAVVGHVDLVALPA